MAESRERIENLIGELASARDELIDARHASVWAATFPARAAGATPPTTIAGGRRKVLEKANIGAQVQAERLWELLLEDARHLASALTEEQAGELGMKRPDETVWANTDAGRAAERKEKKEALERHRQKWGRELA